MTFFHQNSNIILHTLEKTCTGSIERWHLNENFSKIFEMFIFLCGIWICNQISRIRFQLPNRGHWRSENKILKKIYGVFKVLNSVEKNYTISVKNHKSQFSSRYYLCRNNFKQNNNNANKVFNGLNSVENNYVL